MKRRLFLAIAMLLAVVCVWSNNQKKSSSKTIYYVVVGSFTSLEQAQQFNNNAPGDIVYGNIYKVNIKGKTTYRVCTNCYYSKAKAKKETKELYDYTGGVTNAWIWASKELALCVERGIGNNGEPYSLMPK